MSVLTKTKKVVLNFLEDKPERYKLVQVNTPAVTYSQLIEECSVSCGVHTNQTKNVIDALVNRIVHYMKIGHAVQMGEFGSFKPTFRCKTAKRAEDVTAKTITRKVVRFFPGKSFRAMLAQMTVISAEKVDEEGNVGSSGSGAA